VKDQQLEAAATSLGVQIQSLPFQGPDDLENAFAAALRDRPQALLSMGDPVTFDRRAAIIAFAGHSASLRFMGSPMKRSRAACSATA